MNDRIRPHNLDAERAVIGAVLVDNRAMAHIQTAGLSPSHFYTDGHQEIFTAMESLHYRREPIDLITLPPMLKDPATAVYLAEIADQVSTSASSEYHARLVVSLAIRRKLIQECGRIANQAFQPYPENDELLSDYRRVALEIQAEDGEQDDTDPVVAITRTYDEIMRRASAKDYRVGPLTGFTTIDKHLFGLEPGATYYVGGESTTGKTALALQIADQVTDYAGGHTLYYTLESTAMEVNMRRISRVSGIALTRVRLGNLRDAHDDERITKATDRLSDSGMRILDDTRYCDFNRLQAHAESFALEHEMTLIVVDFLQQLDMPGAFRTEHHKYKTIANAFNRLAKTLNIPVMILSQLNEDGKLKESRDIHNTAIHEWILERENQESEQMKIRGVKAKNSGPWTGWLRFERYTQTFYDMPKSE